MYGIKKVSNNMKMYSPDGNTMIESISLKKEGRDLVMKARVMETLLTNVYIKPEEVWKGRKLLSFSVVLYLPVMLLKGIWNSMRKK